MAFIRLVSCIVVASYHMAKELVFIGHDDKEQLNTSNRNSETSGC